MAVLVILDANPDEPEGWHFLKADEYDGTGHWDDNRTFPTAAKECTHWLVHDDRR